VILKAGNRFTPYQWQSQWLCCCKW